VSQTISNNDQIPPDVELYGETLPLPPPSPQRNIANSERFLHNHTILEAMIHNNAKNHVVIDREDWVEAKRICESAKDFGNVLIVKDIFKK
jgi:hypothetical protein